MCYSKVLHPGRWSVSARAVSVSCVISPAPAPVLLFRTCQLGLGVLLDSHPPTLPGHLLVLPLGSLQVPRRVRCSSERVVVQ